MKIPRHSPALNVIGAAALAIGLLSVPGKAAACSYETYIGSICMFPFNFCPHGTIEADGRLLAHKEDEALFSLIGAEYGGNGRTNFALPNLKGREVVGAGEGKGLSPTRVGEIGGQEIESLGQRQMPQHSHRIDLSNAEVSAGLLASDSPASLTNPEGAVFGIASGIDAFAPTANTSLKQGILSSSVEVPTSTTGSTGNGAEFGVVGPQLGLKMCVVLSGQYPPKP